MNARWAVIGGVAIAVAASVGVAPAAQWQGWNIALRTNGSIMRPGDCLRVEAFAFAYAAGPFVPRVRYTFTTTVPSAGTAGSTEPQQRLAVVDRAPGPAFDAMEPYQTVLLDDTFCFGHGTTAGRYDVEVEWLARGSPAPLGVLRTCVLFDDGSGEGPHTDCGLMLRGIKRADSADSLVFDGDFPGQGTYRAAIFRNHTFDRLIDAGVYQTGPHELVISAPGVWAASAPAVDLLLFDEASGNSTSLARLTVPIAR